MSQKYRDFAVDYWTNMDGQGDPDRTDYSDSLYELQKFAATANQAQYHGERIFKKIVFYRRKDTKSGEMDNWEVIR